MFRTIGAKVLAGMIAGAVFGVIGVYVVIALGLEDISERNAKSTLAMMSESIFQTLQLAMLTGEREVVESTLVNAGKIAGVRALSVAPSKGVIETFHQPVSFTTDPDILGVFGSKQASIEEYEYNGERLVRLLKPQIAEDSCIRCHVLNNRGDVLGVMDLTLSLKENDKLIAASQAKLLVFEILTLIVAIIGAVLFIKLFNYKIHKMQSGLLGFFAFLNGESSRAKKLEDNSGDEFGQISQVINSSIERIEQGVQRDREFIQEATKVVARVNHGYLDDRLEAEATTPALNELKVVINNMISSLDRSVESVLAVLRAYESDDYTATVSNDKLDGKLSELLDGVNSLGESIGNMLCSNLRNGRTLEANAKQLGGFVRTISKATDEQAEALMEASSAVTQIAATIKNTAEKAVQMASIAETTHSSAVQGSTLAKNTLGAMEEIVKSAHAISEAIGVIDTIAFQTNILSLNAAVEAATAGEAGKGFAVVAGEVRALAGRSAEAARRIKELATQSLQKAEEGKEISMQMMHGYNDLSEKIKETSDLVSHVAEASKEQMGAIDHINEVVATIERQTKSSSQVATKTNAIAEENNKMAAALVSDASGKKFKVSDDSAIHELKSLIEQG